MPRRGRRPAVWDTSEGFEVTVRGQKYAFRLGNDQRLRALGSPDRSTEDFAYAKELVKQHIDTVHAQATQ